MAPSQPQGSSGRWEWPQDGVTAGWVGSPGLENGERWGQGGRGFPGVWSGSHCSWQQEPWARRARPHP